MSLFDSIDQLLFKNKKISNSDAMESFVPYMVNRYFSFYKDGKYVGYINDSLNRYSGIFNSKEDSYSFYDNIIPKLSKTKINYIKKLKEEKEEEIPTPEFYSKKEIEILKKYLE